jgi:sugar O-acyltransferase (sialic acid O-acetyltransferase NeuD family)
MAELTEVVLPRANVNDEAYVLTDILVSSGSRVRKGSVLFTCEGSKSTFDVDSPATGHVYHALTVGSNLPVGVVLGIISETELSESEQNIVLRRTQSEPPGQSPSPAAHAARDLVQTGAALPRFSRKARELLEASNLDPHQFQGRQTITEADVEAFIASQHRETVDGVAPETVLGIVAPTRPVTTGLKIIIYGAGGHATMCIDLLRRLASYHIVGLVDDKLAVGTEVMGVPVIGPKDILRQLHDGGIRLAVNAVGGVPNTESRQRTFDNLTEVGFVLPNLIHPTAIVEPSAELGAGNHIMAGAIVGSRVKLHDNCVVNTGAIVSHDSVLESHSHVAPGAVLAGGVRVGEGALVGMAVSVYMGARIGERAVVTNGVSVFGDVPAKAVVKRRDEMNLVLQG